MQRRARASLWLLAAVELGLACRSEPEQTGGELVAKNHNAPPSTSETSESGCGDRAISLIVNKDGGCIEDCDGTRWCWGADLRARRAKPDEPDELSSRPGHRAEFESEYLTCLRDPQRGAACRDSKVQIVVVDEHKYAEHECSIDAQANVACTGDNRHAQLGLGHSHADSSGAAVELPGSARAVGVAAQHTCAALEDRIMCWGMPKMTGRSSHRFDFEAVDVFVDDWLSCARKVDGTIWCWGSPDEEGTVIEDRFGGIEAAARPRQVSVPWPADAVGPSWVLGKDVLRHVRLDGALAAGDDDVVWQTSGVRGAEAGFNVICVHWKSGRLRCVWADQPDALEEPVTEDWYPESDRVTDFAIDEDSVCVVRRGKVRCATEIGGWTHVEGIESATRVANDCALRTSGAVTCWSLVDANSYAISEVSTTRVTDAVDIAADFVLSKHGSLARIDHAGNQPVEREASPHGGRRPSTGGFHGREDNLDVMIERGVVQFDADVHVGERLETHACARIDDDGDGRSEIIECVGSNEAGQLGKPSDALLLAPTAVVFD